MKSDPLLKKERQAIADELTSAMRHDVRNRLSAIRNAAFYLKRRVSQLELWTSDARIEQFFKLIDESVAHADQLLKPSLSGLPVDGTEPTPTSAASALSKAAELARVGGGISFELLVADADVYVDADELALAVRCLLEAAAADLGDAGVVHLRGANQPSGYAVDISPWSASASLAEGEESTSDQQREHAGGAFGIAIARRIARRHDGSLEMQRSSAGVSARLTVPSRPSASPAR